MYACLVILQFDSFVGLWREVRVEISYFGIFQMRFYCWLEMLFVSEIYYPILQRGTEKFESRKKLLEMIETKFSSST